MARRLERLAADAPEQCAIRHDDTGTGAPTEVGHGELNRRADRIADLLATCGAGPKTLVAVVLPRSYDLVASLCAVLKVGATCLPVAPDTPVERTRRIIADLDPHILITARDTDPGAPIAGHTCILDGDAPAALPCAPTDTLPEREEPDPTDIAYVSRAWSDGFSEAENISYSELANYIDESRSIPAGAEFLELILPLVSGNHVVLESDDMSSRLVPFVEPRDVVEEVLAQIWCSVLDLDRVGIRDRFFDLGGRSLLAVKVVARVRKLLNVELPLKALFDAPTIEELAAFVRAGQALGPGHGAVALEPVERGGPSPLPLSFAQQRLWFLDQLVPDSAFYNMCDAFRVRGALDVGALERALKLLVERHETLRTAFGESDGVPFQIIADPTRPDALRAARVARIDLTLLPPEEREESARRLVAAEAQIPFRLSDGVLLRVVAARLADDDHVLVVTMHHVISDGWSMDVLIGELGDLYERMVHGDGARPGADDDRSEPLSIQ
uniref:condensation domain-containing protein n=1 Tax=Streptomyces sp. KL118A TaxID=3045153 RepID=UPI00278C6134